MFTPTPYTLRAALLFGSLLFGSASAIAQLKTHSLLPNANLGLPAVQVGVGLPTQTGRLGASVSVTVPAVGGLTPPLGVQAGVNVGGSGAPPVPETSQPMAAAPQVAERRLDLLPTCR